MISLAVRDRALHTFWETRTILPEIDLNFADFPSLQLLARDGDIHGDAPIKIMCNTVSVGKPSKNHFGGRWDVDKII